jgi:hypothetical protein
VLAYALISPNAASRDPLHPWLAGIPIADNHRLVGFDLFGLFNDTFFMSLMFLLSGLFVWPSLARKGGARFLRDRVLRLGVPFGVMALLAPIAYYAAYRWPRPIRASGYFGGSGYPWGCGRADQSGSSRCYLRSMASPPASTGSLLH